MLGLIALGVVVVVGAVQSGVLEDYQLDRFRAFTNPDVDPHGRRLQHHPGADRDRLRRADRHRACSTARRPPGKFVPEQQTDFIFTVAGEELGFARRGAGIVLLLGLRAVARAAASPADRRDLFGRLVAAGVVVLVRVPGRSRTSG